jgi:hypothetical protein
MKFYRDNNNWYFYDKIRDINLSAIYSQYSFITFFTNGKRHNNKNAASIGNTGFKEFSLNGKLYGNQNDFTKKSWRKFVKLKCFL